MQNSPPSIAGDIVRVRRALWRVARLRPYGQCQILTLTGIGPTNIGVERSVLTPFDIVERHEPRFRPTFVGGRVWRRECRALIRDDSPPGALRSAHRARIDLLPHQLEPALAVVRGLGSRVLLADDVGLGKTIEAALIVAELQARGADRALILTPPGLRDQWSGELLERFGIEAVVADIATLSRRAALLPVGVNPWSTIPVTVASIDLIKRPEVLPAVLSCSWDVLVVDEAHGATGGSDRHAAVAALAVRARWVVLVTATPHSGDRRAFLSLCGIGQAGHDPLLVFRRSRHDVRLGAARRVHCLHVRLSASERRMHALLRGFGRAVREDRGETAALALSVLHKRALSSPRSLERSVARRLMALATREPDDFAQLSLPLGDPAGESSPDDEAPRWPAGVTMRDGTRERALLIALGAAASAASKHESKVAAIQRLLRRTREPAIVFTEYRDTLVHLAEHIAAGIDRPAVLHGGLTRLERRTALEAFASGARRALLATDAGGEGLNLHQACRLVINLELPWNPTRLEQRIGRVDRIGQRRTVHAIHLIADETGETLILDRLRSRITNARRDIAAADPLGSDAERAVARLIVNGDEGDDGGVAALGADASDAVRIEPRLEHEAAVEVERLSLVRRFANPGHLHDTTRWAGQGPLILRSRRWRTRQRLGDRLLLLWTVSCEDGCGRQVASRLVPLSLPAHLSRADIARTIRGVEADCRRLVDLAAADWRTAQAHLHHALMVAWIHREDAIAAMLSRPAELFQAGLFDRRSEQTQRAAKAADEDAQRDRAASHAMLERSAGLTTRPPRLWLVLAS